MKVDLTLLKSGDRRALSKALTLIESSKKEDQGDARDLLNEANKKSGHSIRIAVTGAPGVGKSTFIDTLGSLLVDNNKKIAVLAIDPSSPIHGGSILGDKTRMERLSQKDNAFIRPSPSKGIMGGVAPKTLEAITICELAGFEYVVVETVGVGQSETDVSKMVDLTILLLNPGGGDDLQGIKKGIMEVADLIIVNKADKSEKDLAYQTANDYRNALHFLVKEESPEVLTVSSLMNEGFDTVTKKIEKIVASKLKNNSFQNKRAEQNLHLFWQNISLELKRKIESHSTYKKLLDGKITPFEAVEDISKTISIKK